MFNSHVMHLKHLNESSSYGKSVWQAFQLFLAALFNVNARAKPRRTLSDKDREDGVNAMFELATKFDTTMPNQAAELRYLASRDGK